MSPHHVHGLPPDRGHAPTYRLAPDTPAEISADLARLCAVVITPAAEPAGKFPLGMNLLSTEAGSLSGFPASSDPAEEIAHLSISNSGLATIFPVQGIALVRAVVTTLAAEPAGKFVTVTDLAARCALREGVDA